MRVIEELILHTDLDPWLSLEALGQYSGLSVRTLRAYLTDPHHPLPHYRMKEPHVIPTKTGRPRTVTGKILVRRSDFDAWMQTYRYTPDLDKLVGEVVSEIRQAGPDFP